MRNLLSVLVILLAASLASAQSTPAKPIQTDTPVNYAFAGITLATPVGYVFRTPDQADLLLHARKIVNETPVLGLRLVAWRVPKGSGTATMKRMTHPSHVRAYTDVTVENEKPIRIADAVGMVQLVTYTFRGSMLRGTWMYLFRPLPEGGGQMGYLLIIETELPRSKELMPILIAVAKSIRFANPIRPIDQKIPPLGEPIASKRHEYQIRPPKQWKATARSGMKKASMAIYQFDYLRNFEMPFASFDVAPTQLTAPECVKATLAKLKSNPSATSSSKVIHEGVSTLGGLPAYEFMILARKKSENKAEPDEIRLIARRTACVGGRSYTLGLMWDANTPEAVKAALDALAAGVKITAKPDAPVSETQPAPTGVPATQPAGQ